VAGFASIDMGTNTFRLLIAKIKNGASLKTIYSENQLVRLGEGFSKRKIIRKATIERTIAVLSAFLNVISKEEISGLIVTGTSAIRDAENRKIFLAAIKENCGLDVHVLSGKEEARLTFLGVSLVFPEAKKEDESSVVIDIGGGSTEIIRRKSGQKTVFVSLGLGAVTLSEKYFHNDPPTSDEMEALKGEIANTLSKVAPQFSGHCRFAGTAGTVTTLAAIDQVMTHYDPDKINRCKISRPRIAQILENLSRLPKEKRRNIPGLEAGREDIIIAGTVILLQLMDFFGYDLIHVSDYGLREGALIDHFGGRTESSDFFE